MAELNSDTQRQDTDIAAASGQPDIQFKDDGTNKGTAGGITTVDFTGAGVTASDSGATLTVNIPGGAGSPAIAVNGIYLTLENYADTAAVAAALGYGSWARVAEGQFLVGYQSGDADFGTGGGTGGAKTHTLSTSQLPSHTHTITDPTHTHVATDTGHSHSLNDPGHAHNIGSANDTSTVTGAGNIFAGNTSSVTSSTATTGATVVSSAAVITVNNASTGITGTDAAGGGGSVTHIPPYLTCYMWKRTA